MLYRSYHEAFNEDPYFQEEYHQCYLEKGEEIFDFEYESGEDFFHVRAVKRPIPSVGKQRLDKSLYDLETVYGYGGYICNSDSEEFVKEALTNLTERCREENIIAHFMRFHPLNHFVHKFEGVLDFTDLNRKVVFIDLKGRAYEEVRQDYSSSLKRNVNKAKRLGLEVKKLDKSSTTAKQFYELYSATMERKGAADMYFFSKEYFNQLFELNELQAYGTFYEEKLISMILLLSNGKEVYYHLGATHADYYSYNPNPFAFDIIVQRLLEEKAHFLFLGGGNAYSEDDPLFRFKKKFSKHYEDFYIGGSVFDPEKFNKLKEMAREQNPDLPKMFLAYRFV